MHQEQQFAPIEENLAGHKVQESARLLLHMIHLQKHVIWNKKNATSPIIQLLIKGHIKVTGNDFPSSFNYNQKENILAP